MHIWELVMTNYGTLTARRFAFVAGAAMMLGFSAGAAQADLWDDFRARCMTPYESFEPSDVKGLSQIELSEEDREKHSVSDVATAYQLGSDATLVLDTEPDWESPDFLVRSCSIRSGAGFDDSQTGFDAWKKEQIAEGLYAHLPESQDSKQFIETVSWIEPKLLFIRIKDASDGSVTYVIAETHLET